MKTNCYQEFPPNNKENGKNQYNARNWEELCATQSHEISKYGDLPLVT